MHRCLQIPELVAEICSHLPTEKYGLRRVGDLVVLARTSKLFSSHALALTVSSSKKSENAFRVIKITMRPRRRLRDSDFERVLFYCPYIQHLGVNARFRDVTPMLSGADGRLSQSVFPVLRGLGWTHEGHDSDVELIKDLLTPHLTELRIHSASLELLKSLSTLGSLCPHLQDLHFSYPLGMSLGEHSSKESALSECLLALQHLSGLPTLRELHFNDMGFLTLPVPDEDEEEDKTSFPSLQKLYFSTWYIESPSLLLAFCRNSPVVELTVELSGELCTTEDMELFFLSAELGISHSSLKEFTFYHDLELDTDGPVRPPVDPLAHIIAFDSLRELCQFHHLVSVYILSGVGVDLDDDTIFHMARSWPHIERLELRSHHGTASPRATLRCLKSFNQFCTKLTKLCMPFDATVGVLPAVLTVWQCVPLESLKELDVEGSPITEVHVKSVARYFAYLFPRLKMLETLVNSLEGETEREEQLIPEALGYHPHWKTVAGILNLRGGDEAKD
ncbi:hypothetical protein FB45DRAFT_1150137 [Roridomyces roridus]|uniref:F-box domain-containing protein n=1 Tax=Roridomyces roridus TaxID=1738132 RepID=A0AAD7FNM3_9AGAR|nr:hypothetical protein FB45DRAFT_1150137 [Roridomyces roridus]